MSESLPSDTAVTPQCKVFGECGGCQYQHVSYEEELRTKNEQLVHLFQEALNTIPVIHSIIPSPKIYHYRNRLDLKLVRTRQKGILIGFSPKNNTFMIPVDSCPIAMNAVSDFIPTLKGQAIERLTDKYRLANLVVKTGDDGRVFWGGIGRRSLRQAWEDYLWTEIDGKRIFYSLETFFQANLSILPLVMKYIRNLNVLNKETVFFDLYGGVGLFGLCFADEVQKVILMEECPASITIAKHNVLYHKLENFEIIQAKVEDELPLLMEKFVHVAKTVMIDPPRKGLGESAAEMLSQRADIQNLLYLSCDPNSLITDLKVFLQNGWQITSVQPFDFFPRTKHLEALVGLKKGSEKGANGVLVNRMLGKIEKCTI